MKREAPQSHSERRGDLGVTYVEAALTLAVLTFILLFVIDLIRVCVHLEAGQYAVNESARWATYGDLYGGAVNRPDALKLKVQDVAGSVGITLSSTDVEVCTIPYDGCVTESGLGSGEMFLLRARSDFVFLSLGGLSKAILFEAVDQNEPF